MLHKRRSFGTRKVSPPQPTCMTDDQKANYLANLRSFRPARPGGARPLPGRLRAANGDTDVDIPRADSSLSLRHNEQNAVDNPQDPIPHSSSMPTMGALKGRPLVQAPNVPSTPRSGQTPSSLPQQPGELRYQGSMSRELEKQEAHSLREALEGIGQEDEENRIYTAAQKEAADLVWKHLNPHLAEQEKTAAYRNPDLAKAKANTVRNQGTVKHQSDGTTSELAVSVVPTGHQNTAAEGLKLLKRGSRDGGDVTQMPTMPSNRRRSSGKRTTSGSSAKGVFRNPEDQIYEEPETIEISSAEQKQGQELPLQSRPRNMVLRGSRPLPEKTHTVPVLERSRIDRFEIYKNPPTQSRSAEYRANSHDSREATPEVEIQKGRAMEIRSDEIRAATSMRRKDRSPKLPTPTAVSDRPGRPIVSFDPTWRPGMESPKSSLDLDRTPSRPIPKTSTVVHSAPIVPTIQLPEDEIPTIKISEDETPRLVVSVSPAPSVPTINLPGDDQEKKQPVPSTNTTQTGSTRPLPQIVVGSDSKPKPRPLPSHTQSSPAQLPPSHSQRANRVPWLSRGPAAAGATVACNACQLPIAGRIVTASGSVKSGPKVRFHPECFSCFHCSTALECISFYPEPEAARTERLQREPNADSSEMRFFCHLDYHDLFSPRCANCKTPIEGAVVLAAGKSWHEGHFFCAECGDPFSSTSPFVEDKGYAYCVGCHTRRTSARCRSCKKQILDEISVEALGGKWHEECFRCDDCGSDFGEDGRFFVREVEIELTEKEKRKGVLGKKFEDRAVCHGCETLRLRRVDLFL